MPMFRRKLNNALIYCQLYSLLNSNGAPGGIGLDVCLTRLMQRGRGLGRVRRQHAFSIVSYYHDVFWGLTSLIASIQNWGRWDELPARRPAASFRNFRRIPELMHLTINLMAL